MTMLIHQAFQCDEVRRYSGSHAEQKAKDTLAELRTVAHPRVRESFGKLAGQIDGANTEKLVAIMQQGMAMARLLTTLRPQVIADIYAKHWS